MNRDIFHKTVKKILGNDQWYIAMHTDPERAKSAALILFQKNKCNGTEAKIVREYLKELDKKGYVTWE